jgi:hypothetical protein
MADKKISALTSASTPLAGTEVLPIVQSGSTVKVPVANLTVGRVVSASGVQVTPSAAAGDILEFATFGGAGYLQAYNNVSGIAALPIDFYTGTSVKMRLGANSGDLSLNIGNLVPAAGKGIDFSASTHAAGMTSELLNDYEEGTWTPTGNNVTFASASGKYTKIGRQVTVTFDVTMPSTANADQCQLQGLPFTVGSGGGASIGYTTNSNVVTFLAGDTGTSLNGYLFGGSALANVTYSGARVVGSCTYFV